MASLPREIYSHLDIRIEKRVLKRRFLESPMFILTVQAVLVSMGFILFHCNESLNTGTNQSSFYIQVLLLFINPIFASCMLCHPTKNVVCAYISIFVLTITFGSFYIMESVSHQISVAFLSHFLAGIYVVALMFVANTTDNDVTSWHGICLLLTAMAYMLLSTVFFVSFLVSRKTFFLFICVLLSFFFSSLYLYVNCQLCGLYFGERTKTRSYSIQTVYKAHPVVYLYLGWLTISLHVHLIVQPIWKHIDGT